jgi:hypothetical protein
MGCVYKPVTQSAPALIPGPSPSALGEGCAASEWIPKDTGSHGRKPVAQRTGGVPPMWVAE